MVNRIVFLTENRFYSRDYQRFGIELLQENNFEVEVWELSSILHPEFSQSYKDSDLFNFDGLRVFNDRQEFYDSLLGLSPTDFIISLIMYRWLTLGLYKVLSKSNANYAVSFCVGGPRFSIRKVWLEVLVGKIKYMTSFRHLETWRHLFIMRLPLWCFGIRAASLIFAAGEKYLDYRFCVRFPIDKNTEILQIHVLDYDLYLKEKDNLCHESPIAVFVDEFIPFHPDNKILKRKPLIDDADSYFRVLNNFFDLVEEKTGLEVVIAAHPRSYYERLPDYFNGRRCIKGETIRLIRESKLVLIYCSTVLKLANLFYKPVIFMTCSDLDTTHVGYYINENAKSFNKSPVFIDRDINVDWEQELKVSKEHYDSYRNAYVKAEYSEELPFWQIVANRLKKGFYN